MMKPSRSLLKHSIGRRRPGGIRAVAMVAATALVTAGLTAGAGASSTNGKKPSGEPIVIGVIGAFEASNPPVETPEWPAAAKARVKAINDAGGIGGRPVKVFECNTGNDPNQTEACVRDAVDAGVVAAVAWNGVNGANFFPLLQQNGIPVIGAVPSDASTLTSPMSFPLTGGVPATIAGLPVALGNAGAKTQAFLITDLGAAVGLARVFVNGSVTLQGYELNQFVLVPPDQADFAPIVGAATEGTPEGISGVIIGDAKLAFIETLRDGGYKGELAISAFDQAEIKAIGDNAEGIIVVEQLRWQGSKNGKLYVKNMKKYAKGMDITGLAANYWLSTWVFEQVAKKIVKDGGTVDAPSLLAAMGQLTNFSTGGMTPPITTTTPLVIEAPIPFTRYFNSTVVLSVVKNGKAREIDGEFINPFEKQ